MVHVSMRAVHCAECEDGHDEKGFAGIVLTPDEVQERRSEEQ